MFNHPDEKFVVSTRFSKMFKYIMKKAGSSKKIKFFFEPIVSKVLFKNNSKSSISSIIEDMK